MKKLFTSDKFFLTAVILTVVGVVPFTICCITKWPEYSYMPTIALVNAISAIALYRSYKNHNKNLMKGLIGFLLMGLLALTITMTFPLEFENIPYTVSSLIDFAVAIMLCLNHFIINSDHHSRSANIRLNQILLAIMFILYITMALIWLNGMTGFFSVMYMAGVPVSTFGVVATIVCVESRLDAYRIDRENAGWTEENGYPEGYVHEYEKK